MLSAANLSGINFVIFLGIVYLLHLFCLSVVGGRILYLSQFKNQKILYILNIVFYISLFYSWVCTLALELSTAFFIPLITLATIGFAFSYSQTQIPTYLKTLFGINTFIALSCALFMIPIVTQWLTFATPMQNPYT